MNRVELLNIDCMKYMSGLPDKAFDLAIVDPPFGIGQNWAKDRKGLFYKHRNNFNASIPKEKYFKELFRVSKHQIIWGANYYWNFLQPTNGLIFWDKQVDALKQHFSAGEIAWTSISKYPLIKANFRWCGFLRCEETVKIHPHQKPVKLYRWLLHHFAKKGDRILDTHLGSGSSAIAAYQWGGEFVGCEIDQKYYEAACKRFKEQTAQQRIIL